VGHTTIGKARHHASGCFLQGLELHVMVVDADREPAAQDAVEATPRGETLFQLHLRNDGARVVEDPPTVNSCAKVRRRYRHPGEVENVEQISACGCFLLTSA
jgi:hypothetical protein